MLKIFFKIAFRNITRHKGFSFITIAGLTLGLSVCLLIVAFVQDELKFDKFVKEGDLVYRIYNARTDNISTTHMASVPPRFATYIKEHFPEVETTNRILMASGKMFFDLGDKKGYEEKWLITEGNFFDIFPLEFLSGQAKNSLSEPNTIVVTESLAKKYFGSQNALNKVIKIDNENFTVKGVIENPPEHFHLNFDFLMSLESLHLPKERMESLSWQQFYTYIKLKPGANAELLERKFSDAIKKETHEIAAKSGSSYVPFLQPLKEVHLKSADFTFDNAKRGNLTYVKVLSFIALFVLVIACFNFVNLATASSLRRAREIGVRKVVGAERKQLVIQFTGESILISTISMVLSVMITLLFLPLLNSFTGKNISFNPLTHPELAILLIAAGVATGILAGIYPAIVLSGFKPIKVLKGMKLTDTGSNVSWLRQGLVIIQFALSAILIICTTIVYRQMNYLNEKDLGFNKEQVLFFPVRGDIESRIQEFKNELKRSPNIISVTAGYGLPGDQFAGDEVIVPGKEGDKQMPVSLFIADPDYIKTLGLKLIAGRDFSKDITSDVEDAFIINETAQREMGYETAEKALGKPLKWKKWEPDSIKPIKEGRIIGVVKDFHYKSLHEKVAASVLQIYPQETAKIAVKIRPAHLQQTISFIDDTWNKFSPDYPLDFKFLDENFEEMYQAEEKMSKLLLIFTALAIFVGCMGLFGLATYSAQQRTKEISIRKVLGATVQGVVLLLTKDFMKLILIALIIASPVALYFMNEWLENFVYRINISWWIIPFCAITALSIAFFTICFQAIKAAVANPVKNLRTE
ncbi:ABC transporter permease [Rubrolithibacter danxiaensis]|uniref:ABC transporter permease n=1 Tax=Rubrolithibacter danxiaensis TaxID=3390805 RepID=UPI003BF8046C